MTRRFLQAMWPYLKQVSGLLLIGSLAAFLAAALYRHMFTAIAFNEALTCTPFHIIGFAREEEEHLAFSLHLKQTVILVLDAGRVEALEALKGFTGADLRSSRPPAGGES